MSEPSPAFQFYPKDFLLDEHVGAMSLEARGAYITLLCYAWIHGELPGEVPAMSRLLRCDVRQMSRLWMQLGPCFARLESGNYVQPRIEREREKQAQFRESQRTKGVASGKARLNPVQPKVNRGSTTVQPSREPEGNSSSSSSFASSSSIERAENARSRGRPRAQQGSGAMAGSLPRDHIKHAFCGRKCVPDFLHGEFVRAFGDAADVDDRLTDWYQRICDGLPQGPIGDEPVKFWRAQFASAFQSAAPSGPRRMTDEEKQAEAARILVLIHAEEEAMRG